MGTTWRLEDAARLPGASPPRPPLGRPEAPAPPPPTVPPAPRRGRCCKRPRPGSRARLARKSAAPPPTPEVSGPPRARGPGSAPAGSCAR
ncbi:hypothetical protein VULLAG_LOCUS2006 [Vulpes lagopus]